MLEFWFGMLKGFNSDIIVRGKQVHIQTEDWGSANPYFVTRVFVSGAVKQTIKVSYREALPRTRFPNENELRDALQKQHQFVMDEVYSGQVDLGL